VSFNHQLYNLRFEAKFDEKNELEFHITANIYDEKTGNGKQVATEILYEEQFKFILKSINAADVFSIKCPVSTISSFSNLIENFLIHFLSVFFFPKKKSSKMKAEHSK
jgi:hypothetical protein